MPKPKLFVGSSSEWIPVARAVKQQLRNDAEAEVWDEGIFHAGNSTLDDLLTALDLYDFAVFVFGPDDLILMRDAREATVRDNVVFELGLFMGKLGKHRTIWVVPKGKTEVHIPTDLQGITCLRFDSDMTNRMSAIGYVAEDLRSIIREQGVRTDNRVEEIDGPRILCGASEQFAQFGFDRDISILRAIFGDDVSTATNLKSDDLSKLLTQQAWDILHLAGFVQIETGDFCFGKIGEDSNKIPARGVARLAELARVRLVVLATCDSLALAAQLARVTNVIAAAGSISVDHVASWASLFYSLLGKGKPLSQAFEIAKDASDAPLVLVTRKDFRLTPRTH